MATAQRLAVIITALPVEREAVCEHLRNVGVEPTFRGSIYRRGVFDDRSEPWDVIVAEIGAGNEGAAAEAVRIIDHYGPQVAIFVGVAGAIKDLKRGDVVASTKVYGYESGKDHPEGFKTRPSVQLPAYALEQRARFEAGEPDWRQRIKGSDAAEQEPAPVAKVSPIVAGEKILASNRTTIYEFIRNHYNDAIAAEMEGHGFLLGVHMNHPTLGIVIRSISDCLFDKNEASDEIWQPIAARHAAAFAFQVLAKLAPEEVGPASRTLATAASVQQVRVGDVCGNNNSVTIDQNQGASLEEIARLVQTVVPDANSEIDAAYERLKAGEPDVAIHLLNELRKRRWDTLKPRERYRLLANMGHAREHKGERTEAARLYMDAKQHQPQDENARALEGVAYYLLGDKAKAFALAEDILKEHPNCALAIALRLRGAPAEFAFSALEQSVPTALREELQILHALSWRALASGEIGAAERLTRSALKLQPQSTELLEQLGAVIVQVESRAKLSRKPTSPSRLEEAITAISTALTKYHGSKVAAHLRYTRAEAQDLLGRPEEAESDFRAAMEIATQDADVVNRFALFLMRRGRNDAAIEILRQADKVHFDPRNRLLLANLLGERNRTGDRASAASLLRETIPMVATTDPEMRSAVVATLTRLLGSLERHEDAIGLLDGLGASFLTAAAFKAIRTDVLLRAGREDGARTCALEALAALEPGSHEEDRMRVAEALGFVGAKREALTVWKSVLKPDRADPFVHTALECARACADEQFILSFCKQLRAAGVMDPYAMELEVVTQEEYRMNDEAIAVMQTYLSAPQDEALARVFRVRLALLGIRLARPELVETDAAKLPPVQTVPAKLGAAVAYILKNGPRPELGVNYAYELVRRHYNDAIARQAYVGTIGIDDGLNDLFPVPAAVVPGCAVKYKADDTREEKWVIIEDEADPRLEREEIGPGHSWAWEMANKAVGERFHLRRDPIQSRTATIQAICSKYVYRKFEIIDSWEQRFPDQFFVRKYTFPTNEDGSPDIAPILKALDLREQQLEEMHALYRNNLISVTSFAKISDAGVLESLSHLASEGSLPIRCCAGTADELERAEAAFANADTLVLDASAIATLFFSGQYEHLQRLNGRCVVCVSTLDDYLELQRKLAKSAHGFLGKFKGKYLFREDDPEERRRQELRLAEFLTKIRSLVTIKSGECLAEVSPERREQMISLFGQPTAESIAEAAATGAVLWTDDIAVAEVAREWSAVEKRVWTQVVFKNSAAKEVYADLTLFLLQWRYFFTRVESDVLLAACHTASWNPDAPPLRQVIEWLGASELNHLSALAVCVSVLPLVWKQASEISQRESVTRALVRAILGREGTRWRTVASIENCINQVFAGDMANRDRCKVAISEVLNEGTGPGTNGSKAAMARVLKTMRPNWNPLDEPRSVRNGKRKGGAEARHDLTPQQRADRRRADRKRNKNNQKKRGK